jgi:hypothetical protein
MKPVMSGAVTWIRGHGETIGRSAGVMLFGFRRQQLEQLRAVLMGDIQVARHIEDDERPTAALDQLADKGSGNDGFSKADLIGDEEATGPIRA